MRTSWITAAALLAATLAVPQVRARLADLLARLARGTNVHVVPPPEHR